MSMDKKCLRCGSENTTPANFEPTGKTGSLSDTARLVTVMTTGVLVNATLCLDCGHIEMSVNPDKARALSKASCIPILMLIWSFLDGGFTPFKPCEEQELSGSNKTKSVYAETAG